MTKKIVLALLMLLVISSTCFAANDFTIKYAGVDSGLRMYAIWVGTHNVGAVGYSIDSAGDSRLICAMPTGGAKDTIKTYKLTGAQLVDTQTNEVVSTTTSTQIEAVEAVADHWFVMYWKPQP